ncbi:PepSY domain-containing protein [Thalassotalea sediminis]|uniref:PepSY domain-containing protein n=1 Tax=Thalassotalea sediminis TaxID=1759089 RepID=UPI002573DA18|nr:PepSY domain-containing protein [Thalassotalea sediminis]
MRKFHQVLGLIMLLPFIAWAITGVYFFFKPGYQTAYQPLYIKAYPIKQTISLPEGDWREVRQIKTILGHHVMLKTKKKWLNYLMPNWAVIDSPNEQQVNALIQDAITANKARYGDVLSIDGNQAVTTTDVNITLNWQQLSLRQQGQDTHFINTMYNIHYLRWTGHKTIDQYLGVIGLILVVILAGVGTWMTFKPRIRK